MDVFAWTYNKMPGLDPRLVIHSPNVDPRFKPIVQPARVFHTDIEAQKIQGSQEATSSWVHQANPASQMALQHSTHEEKRMAKFGVV